MLYVIRHGQTDWNVEGKTQGSIDIKLNETGKEQAEKVKNELMNTRIDVVLCSPRNRCKETAKIVSEGRDVQIIELDELRERDFGEFEGKKKNIEYDWVEFWNWKADKHYEKAENVRDFFDRVSDVIEKIRKDYADKNVLIVTHAGICAMMYCYFNNLKPDGKLKIPGAGNCELNMYDV